MQLAHLLEQRLELLLVERHDSIRTRVGLAGASSDELAAHREKGAFADRRRVVGRVGALRPLPSPPGDAIGSPARHTEHLANGAR